ncbi:Pycsar system effector family protein [Urechidicola vernalis]|uniref:DUF5706 domain-containing protein n=1 Tax=Urechidicola vernalis TaxID=3075600 RepID=A0ABU2Y1S3_9FLAO|nr:Pycsar system effector family protein [Urechidicola sp. P050]MDT0551967.1 DUF5706 domain-containing protein [Urechidicola sp. P050]
MQDPNNYWEQLERLEKLIRASEFKAGVIFSFHSLILGLFVDKLLFLQEAFKGSFLFIVLVCLWICSVLISIYFCFRCFMPRIEMNYKDNVFFFKDAVYAFGNKEAYSKRLLEICNSQEDFFEQLSYQIHAESKIIDKKFDCVQKSIRFFAVSFLIIFALLIYYLAIL